ncbi:MAG: methyltransferase domain-containing protein [Planctomycetaceae bacterium]|nr:methyltransferase domain-containing protein [Planctomycetaceae bacterium]
MFLDENQAKATTATRLFRNDELFAATRKVVGDFLRENRTGKYCIWSTGCSSGEEVYSMAMIALTEFEKAKKQPLLEAFGTDINPQRIAEGRMGVYGRPSKDAFAANYWHILAKYATMSGSEVQMGDLLRSVCKFTLFDMRKTPKKHTFHFIVCNHVLQYYDAPGQRHIIGNLKAVLKPGGFLYLEGVTEHGLDGLSLQKRPEAPNLYAVVDKSPSGRLRGITRRLFRK